PRYASVRLVAKNIAANTAVRRENKVVVPRAPNTVPDAPEPKPAPASAPLPRCRSTSPMIMSASKQCRPKTNPCNILKVSVANGRGCRADLEELVGAQRCTADQASVHVGHGEQLGGIAALDAAAVENAQLTRHFSILCTDATPQKGMHFLGL